MILEIALLERPKIFKRKLFNRCKVYANDFFIKNISARFLLDLGTEEYNCTTYILNNFDKTNYELIQQLAYNQGFSHASAAHVITAESDEGKCYGIRINKKTWDIPTPLAHSILKSYTKEQVGDRLEWAK